MTDRGGAPAGDPIVKGERRAPVVLTILVAIALPLLMPPAVSHGERWIVAGAEAVLLVVMLVLDPGRIDEASPTAHRVRLALVAVLAVGAAVASVRLVGVILDGGAGSNDARDLFRAGGLVWLNVIIAFGFAYWELDGGGPGRRVRAPRLHPDFQFAQDANPALAPAGWRPHFVDYLYVSFCAAMCFGPADTLPLARWAKLTLAVESMSSLFILGLVLARGVNILS